MTDQDQRFKQLNCREWFVVFWLVALVAIARIPSLEEPYDNDSASTAYHTHLILEGEPLYGSHHPGHHMPGLYYTYAIVFLLMGESSWAVKFVLIPWTIVTAYMVYRFGLRLRDFKTGVLAASIFALLTAHVHLMGTTGKTEMFANCPRIAAVWLCVELIERRAKNPSFALVGALGAVAFLYKAIYLSPMFVSILLLVVTAGTEGKREELGRRLFWMAIGFCLVIFPVIGYFFYHGLLNRFLWVFRFGMGYVKGLGFVDAILAMIIAPIIIFGAINPLLLIIGIAGFFALSYKMFSVKGARLSQWRHAAHEVNRNTESGDFVGLGVVLWFAMSVVEAGIGHPGLPHYSLLLTPHFSLLCAWCLTLIYDKSRRCQRYRASWAVIGVTLMVVSWCILTNSSLYYQFFRYKYGMQTYESFLLKNANGRFYLSAKRLADYIEPRTSIKDYVYFWSDNMVFFNLVHRRAPTENQWPYYATAFGSYKRIFVPQTKYFILGESALRARPQWLYDELRKAYSLETIIDGQEIYRRNN